MYVHGATNSYHNIMVQLISMKHSTLKLYVHVHILGSTDMNICMYYYYAQLNNKHAYSCT